MSRSTSRSLTHRWAATCGALLALGWVGVRWGAAADPEGPAFQVLLEIQEPGSGEWRDGDGDFGSAGVNDGRPVQLFTGEDVHLRVSVTNTGTVDLEGGRVRLTACGLDAAIERLPVGTGQVLVCEIAAPALAGTAVAVVDGLRGVAETLAQGSEEARFLVFTPGYTLLHEAQDTSTGEWLDADADAGSAGSNDGRLAKVGPGGLARFRITVVASGQTDLADVRVTQPLCGLDRTVARLRRGDQVSLVCERSGLPAGATARASVVSAIAVTPDGRRATVPLPVLAEDATIEGGQRVVTSGSPDPGSAPLVDVVATAPPVVTAGEAYQIRIGVRARFDAPAVLRDVVVRFIPSPRARVYGASAPGALATRSSVRWDVGGLAPGAERSIVVRAKVPGIGSGNVSGTVTVTGPGIGRIVARVPATRIRINGLRVTG